jgi:malate dehydrogenase
MVKVVEQVVLTGAGGHVGQATAQLLAQVYANLGITWHLRLVELPERAEPAEALRCELEDSCWPGLEQIEVVKEGPRAFEGGSTYLLAGAQPRQQGQSRRDLLAVNAPAFARQGSWIGAGARADAQVWVIGNPANSLALVTWSQSGLQTDQVFAMTALDSLRAQSALARKAKSSIEQIHSCAVWGNHSESCVPDGALAKIGQWPASEVVDSSWLRTEWPAQIRERGAQVIQRLGRSAALSAARAAVLSHSAEHLLLPEQWISAGCWSDGRVFPPGLFVGAAYGLQNDECGPLWDKVHEELIEALRPSISELIEERDAIRHLLGEAV